MRFMQMIGMIMPVTFLVVACQSEMPAPTPYPTYTAYPTYTPYPTLTPPPPAPTKNNLPSAKIEDLVWPTGPRDDVIPFEDAADFIGEKVTVEGAIARTYNSGKAVFLNFSEGTKDTFTVVIFSDDWPKFPSPPENLFAGKLVRVEGVIEEYKGTPEIIIKSPSQIEVALTLGQPVITDCDCPQQAALLEPPTATPNSAPEHKPTIPPLITPEPQATSEASPTTAQEQIISWENAAAYQGQYVIVAGRVVDTYNSGKVVFLNFDEDYRTTFKVAIFSDAWPLFPAPPEDYYQDKTVQVRGQIKMYQNAPEIIVDHPDQIELME